MLIKTLLNDRDSLVCDIFSKSIGNKLKTHHDYFLDACEITVITCYIGRLLKHNARIKLWRDER